MGMALHHLASRGRANLLERCLRLANPLSSAINAFDTEGQTPLMCAAKSTESPDVKDECIMELIEYRADVNLTDAAGLTALGHLWRCAREHLEVEGGDRGLLYGCWSCDVLADKLTPSNGPTQCDEAVRVCHLDHLGVNSE